MPTLINDPGCNTGLFGNLGKPTCDKKMDTIEGISFHPKGTKFTVAQVAAFVTTCQTRNLGAYGSRVYFLWDLAELKDNSEEDMMNKSGYGEDRFVRYGKYSWQFMLGKEYGAGFMKKLRTFQNNQNFDIMIHDKSNVHWGKYGDATNPLLPIPATFSIKKMKVNDGNGMDTQYWVEVTIDDARDLNENITYIAPDTTLKDYTKNIIDVTLTEGAAEALHSLKIKATATVSGVDMYSAFQDLLAVPGAWVVTLTSTGAAKTVSGVAKSAVYNGWTLTLSDDSAGEVLSVSLATPAALAALTVPVGGPPDNGYESNVLSQTIPT